MQQKPNGKPAKVLGIRRPQQLPLTISESTLVPPPIPTTNSGTTSEGRRRKILNPQARELVLHVVEMCELERSMDGLIKPLSEVTGRTALLTGVPEETIWHVKHKSWKPKDTGEAKKPPTKKTKVSSHKMVLDDRDIIEIKNLIRDYHIKYCKVPSIKDLLPHVVDYIPVEVDNAKFFRRVLHNIGYRRKKLYSTQAVLVEDPSTVACRDEYLSTIRELRSLSQSIFYVYECVIDRSYSLHKAWVQKYGNNDALQEKRSYTLICAASINGFLKQATSLRKTNINQRSSIACGELTSDLFEKWLKDHLIPHVPKNSIVIMDNAPHHSMVTDKPLSYYASRREMMDYLNQKNIEFDDNIRRTELYKLVEHNTPKRDVYTFDDVLAQHGHKVLRLPPYMIDLNPTQFAMDYIQQELCGKDNYETFNLRNVHEAMEEVMTSLTQEDWKVFFDKVLCLEDYYWEKDGEFEVVYDKILKNMRDCVDVEDDETSEDSDDDDL